MSELAELKRSYEVMCNRLEAMTEAYEKLSDQNQKIEASNTKLRAKVKELKGERDTMLKVNTELSQAITQVLFYPQRELTRLSRLSAELEGVPLKVETAQSGVKVE